MSDYTPTTEEIRDWYSTGQTWMYKSHRSAREEFDRWLAARDRERDREVAARALEEAADVEGDWTARTWRPEEAESVVKMRKGLRARAESLRTGGDTNTTNHEIRRD